MPIYEYRCANGHTFDVFQNMSDDPVETCETCGARVERVFHPVAVHFKGSGFYTTDYARKDGKKSEGGKEKAKKGSDKAAESKTSGSKGSGDGAKTTAASDK